MIYRKATIEDLNQVWDKDIARNNNSPTWIKWKEDTIEANINGDNATFVAVDSDDVIGQITVVFSNKCLNSSKRDFLCDNKSSVTMSAFRIDKKYEGQGHISKLINMGEEYAKSQGRTHATIGAEAKESRNLAIYLHKGYTNFITYEIDKDEPELDDELILYYGKEL